MRVRLLGAAIVVPLVLLTAAVGNVAWGLLLATAAAIAAAEETRLVRSIGTRPTVPVALALAPLLAITGLWPGSGALRLVVALGVILALLAQIGRRDPERSTNDFAATLAWPTYVGVLMSYAVLVRGLTGGLGWVLLLLLVVWSNDSFAYLGGRAFGKTPFFASLSPRKTVEGAVCGTLAAVAAGFAAPLAASALIEPLGTIWGSAGPSLEPLASSSSLAIASLGLAVSVVAPLGDLSKSFLKRQVGAKDSGTLIPGHGGVLDRMDSLLFAAPVVYYAVLLGGADAPIVLRGLARVALG